jgi:hypothetical protein
MVDWYGQTPHDSPWSSIPLGDRMYLIYLEARMRRLPPWMLGTLYEAIERLKEQPRYARDRTAGALFR